MARRISASQLRSKLQQVQQKRQQAISRYNQAVRQYNQKVNQAVNKYNQAAQTHNSRVRANRQRLRSELMRLSHQPTTTNHPVVYRTSVHTLHEAYARLEKQAETQQLGPRYNEVLDLSERETANSLEVTNRLLVIRLKRIQKSMLTSFKIQLFLPIAEQDFQGSRRPLAGRSLRLESEQSGRRPSFLYQCSRDNHSNTRNQSSGRRSSQSATQL